MSDSASRDVLKTTFHEGIKYKQMYDGSNRLEHLYEAPADAEHGAPCVHTQYAYDGASSRIIYAKETLDTWDSSWEAF